MLSTVKYTLKRLFRFTSNNQQNSNQHEDSIKIGYGVNWFLTRKCNLRCSYCAVVNSQSFKEAYGHIDPFKKDIDIEEAKEFIRRLKKHNPEAFHMFLGGEPTVYKHLPELVDFCNKEGVLYTVITNMTDYSYNKIKEIIDNVGFLNGLSFTVDPVLWDDNYPKDDDRYKKSKAAYEKFITLRNDPRIREFVGIVGVDSQNIKYLHRMCRELTDAGVWIDLILMETKLNKYYDFPSALDYDLLVWDTEEHRKILMEVYEKAEKGEYTVLFHPVIKYKMIPNLPQKYICTIDKRLDTMTIDADGKLRLCLRIRGVNTQMFHMLDILDEDGNLTETFKDVLHAMQLDKKNLCYGCQWTCPMAGELIADGIMSPELMNHRTTMLKPRII